MGGNYSLQSPDGHWKLQLLRQQTFQQWLLGSIPKVVGVSLIDCLPFWAGCDGFTCPGQDLAVPVTY
jgi:hypothetical protein